VAYNFPKNLPERIEGAVQYPALFWIRQGINLLR
jgi:hypothetical protein